MSAAAASLSVLDLADLSTGLKPTQLVVLVAVALATYATLPLWRFMRIKSMLSTIPTAPGGNPLIGHVIPLLSCVGRGLGAWDLMEEWLDALPPAKQGKIVQYRILGTQGIVTADPEALKRVFQTGYKLYKKDLALSFHPFLPILGTGLVTADGHLWQKQRNLMGPALRTEVLDDIIPIAKRAVDRMCAKVEHHRGSSIPVDVEEEFRLLTLQVIGEAILSMEPEECDRVFPKLYLPVMEEANRRVLRPHRKYLPIPAWFQFRSRMAQLNSFLIGFIRNRWQQREQGIFQPRQDILDKILAAVKTNIQDPSSGVRWDAALETQLCYEIKTFLLAGHETSAGMLTWALGELAQHPECLNKVRAEADRVFGPNDAEPSRREVDEMTYTLAVLKETLRKYSVVPTVTRTAMEDDELCGHKIPKGTMVAINLQGTHNMYANPKVFDPERFMPNGEFDRFEQDKRAYMFVPFVQGPRNCLGQHMALLEARVVLALLVKRFSCKLADPSKYGVRHPTVIPVGPIDGMKVFLS